MRLMIVSESNRVHTQRWSRSLAQRGHDVTVLSESQTPIAGVKVIPFRVPGLSARYARGFWGRYTKYIRQLLAEHDPDLIHYHFLRADVLTPEDRDGRPLVISTWGSDVIVDHGDLPEAQDVRHRKITLLRSADRITATTEYLADCTAAYGWVNRRDITVIPFGVELERFRPKVHQAKESYTVGTIKHLLPKYGIDVFIRAMPHVLARHASTRFAIAGDGPDREALQALAESLGVACGIDWLGAVRHESVPETLLNFDLFVMPSMSKSETFGVVAVEAQAAGVPIVSSDLPGVREAVQHDVGGCLIPSGDHGALAETVCRLLDDVELRRRLSRQGRRFVQEKMNWSAHVDQMESVYDEVLATAELVTPL